MEEEKEVDIEISYLRSTKKLSKYLSYPELISVVLLWSKDVILIKQLFASF